MTLKRALECEDIEVKTVTLLDDQCGLTDEALVSSLDAGFAAHDARDERFHTG